MKFKKRYCKGCKGITEHTVERDEEGFYRLFAAIVTVGLNELDNRIHYMCTKCEKKETESVC